MAHNEPTKDGRKASSNDLDLILYPLLKNAGDVGCSQAELEKAAGDRSHRVIGRLTDLLDAGIVDHPQSEDQESIDFRRFVLTPGGKRRLQQFYDVAKRLKDDREKAAAPKKGQDAAA